MGSLGDWLRVLRVGNCAIIAVAAYTGYLVGGGRPSPQSLLLPLSAALVAAWGNAVNDYFDLEADKVSKPWRPLPSGRIRPKAAVTAGLAAAALGVATGSIASPLCGFAALLAASLLYLYSRKLKKTGLPGNLLIASLSALNVVYGGLPAPEPWRALMPAAYAFLVMLGREVLKGVEDVEGDKARGVRTVAAAKGLEAAVKLSTLLLLAVVAVSPIPLLAGYGALYAVFAFAGVDAPIVAALLYVRGDPQARAWTATRLLKVPLFSGLLAFLAGGWA